MKETEAVELASNFAQQQGYNVSQYNIRPAKKDTQWEIYFQSKINKPRPGDFFTVYIDDKSRAVQRIIYGK